MNRRGNNGSDKKLLLHKKFSDTAKKTTTIADLIDLQKAKKYVCYNRSTPALIYNHLPSQMCERYKQHHFVYMYHVTCSFPGKGSS